MYGKEGKPSATTESFCRMNLVRHAIRDDPSSASIVASRLSIFIVIICHLWTWYVPLHPRPLNRLDPVPMGCIESTSVFTSQQWQDIVLRYDRVCSCRYNAAPCTHAQYLMMHTLALWVILIVHTSGAAAASSALSLLWPGRFTLGYCSAFQNQKCSCQSSIFTCL